MGKQHCYKSNISWTGNDGNGTFSYTSYRRDFSVQVANKPVLEGSSDPAFRGDLTKYNPEDLLVISLSSCHMLWYLHLCSEAGIIVVDYRDEATGTMEENAKGGRFTEVTLHPLVTVQDKSMIEQANTLHHKAHELCFIANSVNFPVIVESHIKS